MRQSYRQRCRAGCLVAGCRVSDGDRHHCPGPGQDSHTIIDQPSIDGIEIEPGGHHYPIRIEPDENQACLRMEAEQVGQRFEQFGLTNVVARQADGSNGLPGEGPFDRIVAWAAFDGLPRPFVDQLSMAGKPGSIVNVASILGLGVGYGESLYATSKAGLVQLTKHMALELMRNGVRVNALCPGYIETEINTGYFASERGQAYIKSNIPSKKLGQVQDLSGALLLLASYAGSFITGVALPVDGGHLLHSL